MRLSGDYGKLAKMIRKMDLMKGSLVENISKESGQVAYDCVTQDVGAGVAPSGRSWKPLKKGGKALTWLVGSFRLMFSKSRFTITSSIPYAHWHNTGTKHVPKRQILPKMNKLPKRWQRVYSKALEVFRSALK